MLQVEAKMQMEQTVAEARLEQVYQHYKKSRTQLESELVALTSKDRLRIELLKQVSFSHHECSAFMQHTCSPRSGYAVAI